MNENLVVNLGLRLEHENGLARRREPFNRGLGLRRPVPGPGAGDESDGRLPVRRDRRKDTQSDPKALKLGPRAGFVYSLNDKTVVRGGWGIFWAPHSVPGTGANTFATRGYTAITNVVASNDGGLTPGSATLSNPYPNGVDIRWGTASVRSPAPARPCASTTSTPNRRT